MLQHLVYVSSPQQQELTLKALARLNAEELSSDNNHVRSFHLQHRLLPKLDLHVDLICSLDAISPYLRLNPVDLLIYDEREGGEESMHAVAKIRADVEALAKVWGPDFVFPMSRVVAILGKRDNQSRRAFGLGRVQVRDVCINPKNTATIMSWLHNILVHGIVRQNQVGVACSGGGIEGFLYQLGVVYALERAFEGRMLSGAEVFSGVSSGSVVSTLIASGIPTAEVIRAVHGKSDKLPALSALSLFDIASKEIATRLISESLTWTGLSPAKWVEKSMRSIPTGFFKGDKLKLYFHEALEQFGKSDSFKDFGKELYIGATDQDTFQHVIFGKSPHDNLAISDALRASCALPPFFIPTQINGRWYIDGQITRTSHIELMVDRGCRLIFVIDPLKPLSTHVPGSVDRQGGIYAIIEAVKALISTRFESALTHVAERYPDVDFIVFQPEEQTAELMAGSPMRYKIRTELIHLAYLETLRRLRERHHAYSAKLSRFGFRLRSPEQLVRLEKEYDEIFQHVA